MKHLKMLGLAAIAALGLMAFVGAGTASATTLSTDAAGTVKYAVGTELHSTLKPGTSAKLEKTNGEEIATCTTSTVKGKIETATGTWVGGNIGTLTWGQKEGEPPAGECNVPTATLAPGSLEIMRITVLDKNELGETTAETTDWGEVRGKGSRVTLSVFGVSCVYGTGEGTTLGTISGGAAPQLVINAVLPRIEGSTLFCPSTGRWTATYVVTSPHELHIVE